MPSLDKIIKEMQENQHGVRFSDCVKVCVHYFGKPKIKGSHHVFAMPWKGDPRINIQDDKGLAKAYQVKQVLAAIERLKGEADV